MPYRVNFLLLFRDLQQRRADTADAAADRNTNKNNELKKKGVLKAQDIFLFRSKRKTAPAGAGVNCGLSERELSTGILHRVVVNSLSFP